MNKRKIVIFSTQGKKSKVVDTDASKWSELQDALTQAGIAHNGMKAITGEDRHTLESPEAVLPDGEFTLFLMPKKTKSGNKITPGKVKEMSYAELRAEIKNIIENADDRKAMLKYFSSNGVSYTNIGTDKMRKKLLNWLKKFGSGSSSKPKTAVRRREKPKSTSKPKPKEKEKKKEKTFPEVEMADGIIKDMTTLSNKSVLTPPEGEKIRRLRDELETIKGELLERLKAEALFEEKNAELSKEADKLRREFKDVY